MVSLTIATICTFSYGVLPSLWMLLAVSLVHAVADSFTMPSIQVAAALGSHTEHLSAAHGAAGRDRPRRRGAHRTRRRLPLRGGRARRVCTGTAVVMAVFLAIAITLGRPSARRHAEMRGTDEELPPEAIGSGVPDLP